MHFLLFNYCFIYIVTKKEELVFFNFYFFQTVFQMIESQIRDTIFDFRNGVNNTLESIPLVNVVKRLIERTTPLQVYKLFFRF